MEIDTTIYRSPKRKRDPDPASAAPPRGLVSSSLASPGLSSRCLSPSNTSEQADDTTSVGSHSPSMRVTGKFQKLDLKSSIDLPSPVFSHDQITPPRQAVVSSYEIIPPPSSTQQLGGTNSQDFKPPESADFTFESESPVAVARVSQPPMSSSPSRLRSPPPSSTTLNSAQFWQANEITGWSPNDPDEDYYGVNGVGYAKPPAKAWAISQKRKQQIAEYRSRETREARQRRFEKRGSRRGSRCSSVVGVEGKAARVVHFEDG